MPIQQLGRTTEDVQGLAWKILCHQLNNVNMDALTLQISIHDKSKKPWCISHVLQTDTNWNNKSLNNITRQHYDKGPKDNKEGSVYL